MIILHTSETSGGLFFFSPVLSMINIMRSAEFAENHTGYQKKFLGHARNHHSSARNPSKNNVPNQKCGEQSTILPKYPLPKYTMKNPHEIPFECMLPSGNQT